MWNESRDGLIVEKGQDIQEGLLRRGYLSVDINNMVGNISKMIGFFGKEGRIIAFRNELAREIFKFKTWILAKKSLYWTERDANSQTYQGWKKIYDKDGNVIDYEIIDMDNEGIIQSLISMARKLKEYKLKSFLGHITNKEKQNMSILITHLLIAGSLYQLLNLLLDTCEKDKNGKRKPGCWATTTQYGKDLQSALHNVMGDEFIPYAAITMFVDSQGGVFANASIAYNTAINMGDFLLSYLSDDNEERKKKLDRVIRISGIYRTGKWFYDYAEQSTDVIDDFIENGINEQPKE